MQAVYSFSALVEIKLIVVKNSYLNRFRHIDLSTMEHKWKKNKILMRPGKMQLTYDHNFWCNN